MTIRILSRALVLPLLALGLLAGCSLGKENILFVTKTSVGVDVDSKPPSFTVGIDRKEGTIAPAFEGGEVLPQMAGFTSDLGIFHQAIGQSFAIGTPAILMSKYLTSNAGPELFAYVPESEITSVAEVSAGTRRKRYFFGTDTSIAFKVTFGPETAFLPDSLSLGYKRKEIAFVPLFDPKEGSADVVRVPSLLATAGPVTEVETGNRPQAELKHSQFYATGLAASYLAALPSIRQVVVPKIIPEASQTIIQTSIAVSVIGCYAGVSGKHKPAVWNDATERRLLHETDAEKGDLQDAWKKAFDEELAKPGGPDLDRLGRIDLQYATSIRIRDEEDKDRSMRLARHESFVCALAELNAAS